MYFIILNYVHFHSLILAAFLRRMQGTVYAGRQYVRQFGRPFATKCTPPPLRTFRRTWLAIITTGQNIHTYACWQGIFACQFSSKQTCRIILIKPISLHGSYEVQQCYAMRQRRTARIVEGRDPILGPSTKRGPGVSSPETFSKTYMRFGALYCNCCIKIINLVNVKVLLFSLDLFEKKLFATVKNLTGN